MEAVQNKTLRDVQPDELRAVDGGNPALVAGGGLVAIAASPPLLETAAAVAVGTAVGLGLGKLYDKYLRKHFEDGGTRGDTGAEEHETPGSP